MNAVLFMDVIRHFDNQASLARALSVTPSAVSQWLRRASIPAEKAIEIEIITKGKLKAVDLL